jgi:hypothetical protein
MTTFPSKFTFYVDGLGIEVSAISDDVNKAHKLAWASLTDEQRDAAGGLDWIDEVPADHPSATTTQA